MAHPADSDEEGEWRPPTETIPSRTESSGPEPAVALRARSVSLSSRSLAEGKDRHLADAWPVELDQEDALPPAELQPSAGDVQHRRSREQQRPAVGMTIRPFTRRHVHCPDLHVIVSIGHVARRR